MALSDDQRALLRLLALREEGYEDIAALLGVSVAEVRARVRETLAELDTGAAEPPPRGATVPAESEPEPEPPREKERPVEAPPRASGRSRGAEPRRSAGQAGSRPRPRPRRLDIARNRRRALEIAGGALIALLLILFATGAVDIGGGDSDSSGEEAVQTGSGQITQAALTPPEGGDASGRAVFGRIGRGPVLQVAAEGLDPTPAGKSYTVWLYRSPKLVLRVGSVKAPKGGIAAQFPIPTALLSYVAGGAFTDIYVSLTNDGAYKREVAQARRQRRLPDYAGETVLRGPIVGPLVRGG